MKTIYIFFGILLLLPCSFISCSDNEELNSKEMVAYLRFSGGLLDPMVKYTPYKDGVFEEYDETEIILHMSRELLADAVVTLNTDQSMVDEYNKLNGTTYEYLPEGTYNETNRQITLKKGESQGSYKISLKDPLKLAESAEEISGYILPIRISNIVSNDKGIRISENFGVIYYVVTFNPFYNIDYVSETLSNGTFYDKTGWTASASRTWSSNNPASNAVDGKKETSWAATGTGLSLTVDMQNKLDAKGVRILSSFKYLGFLSFYVTKVDIYSSNDNEKWTEIGRNVELIVQTYGVDSYVYFYKPVNCRYLRFDIVETIQGYSSIAEIDVIK